MLPEILSIQLQKKAYQSLYADLSQQSKSVGQSAAANGVNGPVKMTARTSEFDRLIAETAQKYELEEALLKAVVHAESNFNPTAVSHAGAKGLMQLIDQTAAKMGVTNVFNPVENVEGGARYLTQMLDYYNGNEALAVAAYNAGHEAVDHWGGIPPYAETQTYVPRVLDLRNQYRTWTA